MASIYLYCTFIKPYCNTVDHPGLYRQSSVRRVFGFNLKDERCVIVTYRFSRKTETTRSRWRWPLYVWCFTLKLPCCYLLAKRAQCIQIFQKHTTKKCTHGVQIVANLLCPIKQTEWIWAPNFYDSQKASDPIIFQIQIRCP